MHECVERKHDDAEPVIWKSGGIHIGFDEVDTRISLQPCAGAIQHLGRVVHTSQPHVQIGQVREHPTSSAAELQHRVADGLHDVADEIEVIPEPVMLKIVERGDLGVRMGALVRLTQFRGLS